jgi:hypothetical protein
VIPPRRLRGSGAIAALLLSALVGCEGRGAGAGVPIAGTVSHKGKPIARGSIAFVPEEGRGRAAITTIAEGRFALDADGGLAPGRYKVAIAATEGGDDEVRSLIPERYADPDTSGVEFTVPTRGDKDVAIDLN